MDVQWIAVCGLDCAQCEAYQATQANDEEWKDRVAAQWREAYHNPNFDIVSVTCDGCLAFDRRLCSHCGECDIRACGIQHDVKNCAYCQEYEQCERIAKFFAFVPAVKVTLDGIRAGLG
jgi:hypothetical protein